MKSFMKKVNCITVLLALTAVVLGGCKTGMEPHEHEFSDWVVEKAATETEKGVKTRECKGCDYKETEEIAVLVHSHTFSDSWSSDGASHWHAATCEHTEESSGKDEHNFGDWTVTKAATETEKGSHEKTCTVCCFKVTEEIALLPHTHKYADAWANDATHHWHSATCEHTTEVSGKAEHTFGAKYDEVTPPGNFQNGSYKQKCSVCNHVKTDLVKPEEQTLLNSLGTLKVLSDTELASYGITDSSVPAKIAGATYVTFGVYPQTIMASGVTVADGTAGVNNGTAIKNTEITGADYYLGSDGNWYAKATENAVDNGYKYSDTKTVAQSSANSEKYFKVEPIVWRVLKDADGKYMLLAEKLLTANVPYYGSISSRTLSTNTIYPNNYKYSNIRAFLNGINNQFVTDGGTAGTDDKDWSGKGFLQQAFTTTLQAKIAETTVDNSAASTEDSGHSLNPATDYACEDTTDKIFLLSEKEATESEYGFAAYDAAGSGNSRIRKPTDYAKANCCYTIENTNTAYGGWWWLRSPYYYNCNYAHCGGGDGYANEYEYVYNTNDGLLPALFVTK